jgi:transcriptional regulator with XRE-family HTH domain
MGETMLLRDALRHRLRAVRLDEKRWTQEQLAIHAQEQGIPWTRDTVKNIEEGAREVSLEEFFPLFPLLGMSLEELLPEHIQLELAGGWQVHGGTGTTLRRLLDGHRDAVVSPATVQLRGSIHASATATATASVIRLAEQKAAASLGITPTEVQQLAQKVWKQDLTTERDARVSERIGEKVVSAQSLQALRGHVTRQLLNEIRPHIKPKRAKKRSKG